jgi:acyl-CoA synthetase (AMP-forming)/AMP-acid ligase II
VLDAAVVGLPDDRFGEIVAAAVELRAGAHSPVEAITAHVRGTLAAYKVPRLLMEVDQIARGPNGKLDYATMKQHLLAEKPGADGDQQATV